MSSRDYISKWVFIWKLVYKTPKKKAESREKNYLRNFISSKDEPVKKYTNKAEMKTRRKTTLLRNDGRKERQENYPTSAAYRED